MTVLVVIEVRLKVLKKKGENGWEFSVMNMLAMKEKRVIGNVDNK